MNITEDMRLSDLLTVREGFAGLQRLRKTALLRVSLVDAPDVGAIEEKLRALRVEELTEPLKKMLDTNPCWLIAQAWGQIQAVREAVRRSLAAPTAEQSVDLPSHTFEATLKPRLVLSVAGVDWCQINFGIALSAKLKSATLIIVAGGLKAVRIAQLSGSVKLSCEGTKLREFSRPLNLLPEYQFRSPLMLTHADTQEKHAPE